MALRPALQKVSCLRVSSGFPPVVFRQPTSPRSPPPGMESCRSQHSAWRRTRTRLATLRPSSKPSSPAELLWAFFLKPYATVCLPGGPTVWCHGGQATGGARWGTVLRGQACHGGGRPAADSTSRRTAQRRHRCSGGCGRGQAVPCPRRSPSPAVSGVCCQLAFVFIFGNLWDVPTQANRQVMDGACNNGS